MDTYSTLLYDGTQIDDRTLVYATNTGPADLTIKHEGRVYTLPVGKSTPIPWTAMCLWFGDPRSRDRGGNDQGRTKELHRLKFKWGIHTDHVPDAPWQPGQIGFPRVEFTDLIDQAPIPTVISDPDGNALNAGPVDGGGITPEQMQAQIEALQTQLNQVLEQTPLAAPEAPSMVGVERPDGTVSMSDDRPAAPAATPAKAPAKRGPKRDGT